MNTVCREESDAEIDDLTQGAIDFHSRLKFRQQIEASRIKSTQNPWWMKTSINK